MRTYYEPLSAMAAFLNFLFINLISKWYHKTSDLSSIFYRYASLTDNVFRIYRTNKNIFKNHITQLKVIFFAGVQFVFSLPKLYYKNRVCHSDTNLQSECFLKIQIGKPDYIFDFWLVFPVIVPIFSIQSKEILAQNRNIETVSFSREIIRHFCR